jgi:hypothetical protein
MALVLADRVQETSTTTGTGTLTLAGAVAGFQSFSVIGNANTTYYCITEASTGAWEVGTGTYTSSGTTLSRTTVYSSSNANALVNFTSGALTVFCDYPATLAGKTLTSINSGTSYPALVSSTSGLNAVTADTTLSYNSVQTTLNTPKVLVSYVDYGLRAYGTAGIGGNASSTSKYQSADGVEIRSNTAGYTPVFMGNLGDTGGNNYNFYGLTNIIWSSSDSAYSYSTTAPYVGYAFNSGTFYVLSGVSQTAGTLISTLSYSISASSSGVSILPLLTCYNGITSSTFIKSTSTSAGVGYGTGAGSTVTQLTSKSTGVTLNNICGQITTTASALAASTSVSFTLTNSSIAATDVVIVNAANVGGAAPTINTYQISVDSVLAGSCRIHIRNVSASSASQAIVLNFAVIKSVAA